MGRRQALRCRSRRSNGSPCRAYAIVGGTVCRTHGGGAPQVKAKAARVRAERAAGRQLARLDVRPLDSPVTELRRVLAEMVALKNYLTERLESADGAEVAGTVEALRRALDSAARALTDFGRLGLETLLTEAEVRISVVQAEQLAALMRRMALRWGLPDTPATWQALREEMHALESGAGEVIEAQVVTDEQEDEQWWD